MSDIPPEGAPTPAESDEEAARRAYLAALEEDRRERREDASGGWSRIRGGRDSAPEPTPKSEETQEAAEPEIDAGELSANAVADASVADRAEGAPHDDTGARGDEASTSRRGAPQRDFTGTASPEDWRLTDKERDAVAMGLRGARAALEAKDPVKRERKIGELRARILEDLEVEEIDNRIFDLTLTPYPGSPQVVEQAELMEEWLFEQHALKDRFDDIPDGQVQREQYYADLIEEGGELAADAWDRVFGPNKLDLLNVKHLLAEANLIDTAMESGGQSHRDIGYKEAVSSILAMLHPQAEKYNTLPYEEKVRFIRLIEELTVDYLWSLHEPATDAADTAKARRGAMLEPEPARDTFDAFRPAAQAARLRALRHGQKYRVERDGDAYRVIAEEPPISAKKLV